MSSRRLVRVNGKEYLLCAWSGRHCEYAYAIPKKNGKSSSQRENQYFADAACAVSKKMQEYTDNIEKLQKEYASNDAEFKKQKDQATEKLQDVLQRIVNDLGIKKDLGQELVYAAHLKADGHDWPHREIAPWMHQPSKYISAAAVYQDQKAKAEQKKKQKENHSEVRYVYTFPCEANALPSVQVLGSDDVLEIKTASTFGQVDYIPAKSQDKKPKTIEYIAQNEGKKNENIKLHTLLDEDLPDDEGALYSGPVCLISASVIQDLEVSNAEVLSALKAPRREKRQNLVLELDKGIESIVMEFKDQMDGSALLKRRRIA